MKIVHVTPYYPPHLGGMENTVKELAERMAERGHEVYVFTSKSSLKGYDSRIKLKDNLKVYYLNSFEIGHTPIIPSLPFRLSKVIDGDTIVHIHYAIAYVSEIAMLISKLKEAKVVAHIHLDPEPSGSLGFLLPIYKRIFWKLLKYSDAIICPTYVYCDMIAKKYKVDYSKFSAIPCGINIHEFNYQKSKKLDKDSNMICLLFVGRLAKQKNLPILLYAFKILQREYNNIILNVIGDGEEKDQLYKIIEIKKIKNVNLYGAVSKDKLLEAYFSSDIFVLPSSYESFGIVLLEAMASGLPIVASNIPAVREVLDGCGILVYPTPENFANALRLLVENPKLRNKLSKAGRRKVREYDWDRVVEKVLELYKSL